MRLLTLLSERPHEPNSSIMLEVGNREHLNNIRAEILTSKRFAKWRQTIKKELKKSTVKKALSSVLQNDILENIEMKFTMNESINESMNKSINES